MIINKSVITYTILMLNVNSKYIIIKEIILRLKNNKRYIFFYEIMRTFGTFLYKLRVRNN